MAALPVHQKRRCNTLPRGRLRLSCSFLSSAFSDFQVANLIKFNRLKTRLSNRQRIPGYRITDPELVFGVSTFPYAEQKFSGLISDIAAYL